MATTTFTVVGFFLIIIPFTAYLVLDLGQKQTVRELQGAQRAFLQFRTLHNQLRLATARSIAGAPHLKALMSIPHVDQETANYSAEGLRSVAEVPLILIFDSRGNLIADTSGSRRADNMSASSMPGIKSALEGTDVVDALVFDEKIFEAAAVPIQADEMVLGALVIGWPFDHSMARNIQRASNCDAWVVLNEQVVGCSWSIEEAPTDSAELLPVSAADRSEASRPVEVRGKRCLAVGVPLGQTGGIVILAKPMDWILELYRRASLWILGAGLFTTVLAVACSHFISRSITQPIRALTQAAELLAAGDLKVSVSEQRKDETGILAHAFNMMARRIENLVTEVRVITRAEEHLKATDEARRTFLATMSHEIRTPMNGIIGVAELLLATELNAEQRELTQTIYHSSQALLGILNDILDFAKIEAGKLEIETIDFDVPAAVEDAADLLAENARLKGVELATVIHSDVPEWLRGDPGRLRQILLNLLSNAIKFTERGEVVVSSQLVTEASESASLLFEVRDTGIGIPESTRAKLFQPFSQADSSMTRKYGGTGLGLAICQQLVKLMGGEIGCRSEFGKGSTFWFTLQLVKRTRQPTPTVLPIHCESSPLVGAPILIIDSNETTRAILKRYVEDWSMSIECVPSGNVAIETLRDAVAKSHRLPILLIHHDERCNQDARDLALAISTNEKLSESGVVVVQSTYGSRESIDWGNAKKVAKPVRKSRLFDALIFCRTPVQRVNSVSVALADTTESSQFRGARVLLTEDNPANQRIVVWMLKKLGIEFDLANNGLEALAAVGKTQYAVVLMDCQMPIMDGYEATREIRRREAVGRRLPIIALTANSSEEDRALCFAAGMDQHLSKPIRLSVLTDALARFIESVPSA
ncbi:MAG: ATP-binding protein [Planctomycetota bacterium]